MPGQHDFAFVSGLAFLSSRLSGPHDFTRVSHLSPTLWVLWAAGFLYLSPTCLYALGALGCMFENGVLSDSL